MIVIEVVSRFSRHCSYHVRFIRRFLSTYMRGTLDREFEATLQWSTWPHEVSVALQRKKVLPANTRCSWKAPQADWTSAQLLPRQSHPIGLGAFGLLCHFMEWMALEMKGHQSLHRASHGKLKHANKRCAHFCVVSFIFQCFCHGGHIHGLHCTGGARDVWAFCVKEWISNIDMMNQTCAHQCLVSSATMFLL